MVKHIKCVRCRYVRPDHNASERGWTAYECGNTDSEYFMSLLNITEAGNKSTRIIWTGCPYGAPLKRGEA